MGEFHKPEGPEPPGGWKTGEKKAAHFKARALAAEERAQRVERIAMSMASGLWHPTHTAHSLAKEWGISIWTVRKLAQIASEGLTGGRNWAWLEEVRATSFTRFQSLSFKAEAKGELRTAVEATAQGAKVAGISPNPIEHRVSFDDDATRLLVHAGPQVAVDAALAHLAEHVDDFDGARVVGLAAAERAAVKTIVEAEKANRDHVRPEARQVAEVTLRLVTERGLDPEEFLAALVAGLGFSLPVRAPSALPGHERALLHTEHLVAVWPESDEDAEPLRPVLAELVGGRDDDAAE